MSGGAGTVAPGAPNLPATMDNFDTIVNSYDNQPEPVQPSAAKPAPAKLTDAPLGEEVTEPVEGVEEPVEGEEGIEQEPVVEPAIEELAAQARDWRERPDLPDEFLDKRIIATVDGQEIEITVAQARDGWQRRAITTQAQQEARGVKAHFENLIGAFRQQTQNWTQDPNRLEADLEDMELGPHLDHIVKKRFRQFSEEQAILDMITDPQRKAAAAQRFQNEKAMAMQARAQAREAQRQRQLAEQNQGRTQDQQIDEAITRSMGQHRPRALREVGLKETAYTRTLLGRETRALHKRGTPLTYDIVLEAARNAKDMYDAETETAAEREAEKRLAARSKAIPPKRGPAGSVSVKRAKGPASQQQARVSDFDSVMKEWDGGR